MLSNFHSIVSCYYCHCYALFEKYQDPGRAARENESKEVAQQIVTVTVKSN